MIAKVKQRYSIVFYILMFQIPTCAPLAPHEFDKAFEDLKGIESHLFIVKLKQTLHNGLTWCGEMHLLKTYMCEYGKSGE